MKNLRNVASWDRIIRIGGGFAIASLAFWGPENLIFLVGIIPIVTGALGWCPLYTLLGFKTAAPCCAAPGSTKSA